ncbi:MAG: hypothetical protein A3G95_07730 [Flavobacteria bacterium RIFCSPLOWO2_12_FULL_31_7]|nr:MAG: hypothetical protein A3G95_07730 [Flavobacteria bacterium RIFCSPLOWO2_12_FULL_31_7]
MRVFIYSSKAIVALILLQTLYFKFSGNTESVYIFQQLGMEPYGRIGSGVVELAASILLFFDKTKFYASITVVGTMLGAIIAHLFVLGIEVMNDGGTLFVLALIALIFSLILSFCLNPNLKKIYK